MNFLRRQGCSFQKPGWNQLLRFLWEIYYWKKFIRNSHTSDYMNSSVLCVTGQSIKQSIGPRISCIYSIFSLHLAGFPLGLRKYLIKMWLLLASNNIAASHQRETGKNYQENDKIVSFSTCSLHEEKKEMEDKEEIEYCYHCNKPSMLSIKQTTENIGLSSLPPLMYIKNHIYDSAVFIWKGLNGKMNWANSHQTEKYLHSIEVANTFMKNISAGMMKSNCYSKANCSDHGFKLKKTRRRQLNANML